MQATRKKRGEKGKRETAAVITTTTDSPLSPPPLPERRKVGNASRHAPLPPFQTSFETPLLLSVSQRPPPPTPPPPSAPFSRRPPSPKKLARKGHIRMAYIFPPPPFYPTVGLRLRFLTRPLVASALQNKHTYFVHALQSVQVRHGGKR